MRRTPGWLAAFFGCALSVCCAGESLSIWPQGAPDAKSAPSYSETTEYWNGDHSWPVLKRVSEATIEVFRPSKPSERGAAVLVCPGGGYYSLNIQKEGRDVAQWLSEHGIVGIVVKYRLPSAEIMERPSYGPLQDIQEAVRVVRRHAKEWGIQPDRIGVCGFSAGGHVAALASTLYEEKTYNVADKTSARPDFSILVYPMISMRSEIASRGLTHDLLGESPSASEVDFFSADLHVGAGTPPAFLVHAKDDQAVSPEHTMRYARALEAHGVPAELHLYEKGNHGFGLGLFPDSPKVWTDALLVWLKSRGYL